MVSLISAAESVDIQPEDDFSVTMDLYKGKMVDWTWTADKYGLDYVIKDPEADIFYESFGKLSEIGSFTTTISGEWVFIWSNTNEASQTIDYSVTLDYTITLTNQPPTASIETDVADGFAPLTVAFTGSGLDPDGVIVSYNWDLGDGTTSSLQDITHTYTEPGVFTATLTVTDNDGGEDTDEVEITVNPIDPAIVSTSPLDGAMGIAIDVEVIIEFSLPMNVADVESKTSISPTVTMVFLWSDGNTIVTISFTEDLVYATEYTVSIGQALAANGGQLQETTSLSFTTVDAPTVVILQPTDGSSFKKGDNVKITGTSTNIPENDEVEVRLVGHTVRKATVDADGTWSEIVKASWVGEFTISAEYESVTDSVDIKVTNGEDEESSAMVYVAGTVLIIVILILVYFLLGKRGKTEDDY